MQKNQIPCGRESFFFKSSFLVEEGFLSQENFTGMFGVVGLHEAVDILLQKEGKSERYGVDTEADSLGHTIMQTLETLVHAHKSPYCSISGGHFVLHAQVGIDSDIGISRVLESLSAKRFHCTIIFVMQDNSIRTSLLAQVIFFPFDTTYLRNPNSVLDIINGGGFESGMQYLSTYCSDADVIRITGYLAKRSDIEALDQGNAVRQNNVIWGLGEVKNGNVLNRKVRS